MSSGGSTGVAVGAVALAAVLAMVAPTTTDPHSEAGRPAATADVTGAPGPGDGHPSRAAYRWPVLPAPEVLRGFAPPDVVWGPGHRGVDLAAGAGAEVRAAADGVVAFAGRVVDRTLVSVDHPDGIRTTYEPISPVVVAGERVRAGQVVGHVTDGDAGPHCSPVACLHWGARTGPDRYLDPLTLLEEDPVIRLYPSG